MVSSLSQDFPVYFFCCFFCFPFCSSSPISASIAGVWGGRSVPIPLFFALLPPLFFPPCPYPSIITTRELNLSTSCISSPLTLPEQLPILSFPTTNALLLPTLIFTPILLRALSNHSLLFIQHFIICTQYLCDFHALLHSHPLV